jgi:hypothetical protein
MILTIRGRCGSLLSLDLTATLGPAVELQCFQFVLPPAEFRLTRQGVALQEWQLANTGIYDLQHGPGVAKWCRDDRWFINDLNHRTDVATCGVLTKNLAMETRGLAFDFLLLVWPREGTFRVLSTGSLNALSQISSS